MKRRIKWQDWQDIELAQVLLFEKLFNALLISALNWNRQHDPW